MKHLKYFENDNMNFSVNPYSTTGLFEIETDDCTFELIQEELAIIIDILKYKKYNTYIGDGVEIYLYNNTLTMNNGSEEITIDGKYFKKLLNCIDSVFDNIPNYEQYCGDKFDDSYTQKINVDDSVRAARKYNL